ncbi:DUF2851 family protein [Ferruginibacter sp. HRS2-29]|uniref:DUF2851 family protein n=1 Tax=Ferruginibacter sp. HRS2-29 TaxID=2487334 RepID=UPI0020CF0F94|nr:DUF2851 family protein [Ferruginibacter sp. HRS2-29]MCP9752213.1 DUF2851 family protein [Ferruginibacter sp. HRS2-29]
MTEKLLQYIWQFQYYNPSGLSTSQEEPLTIIHPGTHNTNQGPDFLNGKIKVGNTTWAGSIEVHVNSSEWKTHGHSSDPNYDNVILHVVWKHDSPDTIFPFPTLELQNRIPNMLLSRYEELMQSSSFISCEKHIASVPQLTIQAWKERMLVERLQEKTGVVESFLKENKGNWEEVLWWMLARNFGTKINGDVFEAIARSVPLNVLSRNKFQLHTIEALLFGQSWMLDKKFTEAYPQMLQKEYRYFQKKYSLKKIHLPLFFLRMRPANFPTIRLAQLAMLVAQHQRLFAAIKELEKLSQVRELLNVPANDYWHYHYMFDEPSAFKIKNTGAQMIDNILINTIIPVLFAYGHLAGHEASKIKALKWIEETGAEKNKVTHGFECLGIGNKNASDSQALLYMKKNYCDRKGCVECAIGNKILKNV